MGKEVLRQCKGQVIPFNTMLNCVQYKAIWAHRDTGPAMNQLRGHISIVVEFPPCEHRSEETRRLAVERYTEVSQHIQKK